MPSSNVTEISSKTPPLNLLIIEPGNANHSSVIKAQVKRQSHLYPAMLNQADNSEVNLRNGKVRISTECGHIGRQLWEPVSTHISGYLFTDRKSVV